MTTITDIINDCLWDASDFHQDYLQTAIIHLMITGTLEEYTKKYALRICMCFLSADMIYEGGYM